MRAAPLLLTAGLALAGCKKSAGKPPPTGGEPEVATEGATGAPRGPGPDHAVPQPSNDPTYQVAIQQPDPGAPGDTVGWIVVHPTKGFHVNTDYDTMLSLQPPEGIAVAKPLLVAGGDAHAFTRRELTFAVTMTSTGPGQFSVPGLLKFATCDDGACYPKKLPIRFVVQAR